MPRQIPPEYKKLQYKFILQCLADGDTNTDIAKKIGLSAASAKHKIGYMLRRYNARSRGHLVAKAMRKGIIE